MELAGNTFFMNWEVSLITWIQNHLGPAGTSVVSFFSIFGEELVTVIVLGFLYWCYDKKMGKYVGLNALVALVFNPLIKNIFLRRRPYFDHAQISCLRPVEKGADLYDIAAQGYSFPSGHSTNAVSVFASLARYPENRRRRLLLIPAILLPLLVGISRFSVGVHYPSDVLVGWLMGLAAVLLVPYLDRRIPDRRIFYGLLLLITVPGFFYCTSDDYYSAFGLLAGFLAGVSFEEKYVHFENTRAPLRCILRIVFGALIFFGLTTILKKPFSADFLASGTLASHIVRTLRYGIAIFAVIGIYPLAFRRI